MGNDKLEIKAALMIGKPVHEVFEAIVDPGKMSHYFISKSTGRMEEGKTLTWQFPEMVMEFPVTIKKIEKDKYISYYWGEEGKELLVEMELIPFENNYQFTKTEPYHYPHDYPFSFFNRCVGKPT